jgi:CRP-like cAMP-binding protein
MAAPRPYAACPGLGLFTVIDGPAPRNAILAALPAADWDKMKATFQAVPLEAKDVLVDSGEALSRIYFPVQGMVSTVAIFESGDSVEMAVVGAEGVVGIGAVLHNSISLSRHIVEIPGSAAIIGYEDFRLWEREIPAFRQLLFDYAQAFIVQILQLVACNAIHSVQERTARWLLTRLDRSSGDAFALTQQFMAEMLGVSRPMASTVARAFQRSGFITYRRGVVTITNRSGLEEASCECYNIIRAAYLRRLVER